MPATAAADAVAQEKAAAFDAFISYSRKDKALATALTRALKAYKPPRDVAGVARHLQIFQDEADFTGSEYYASIERHLASSGCLIVICSPHARASQYVNDEIRRFAAARGPDRIIPVLCSGLPNNEAVEREDEKAFPEALCEAMRMPLAINYAGFDPRQDKVDTGGFENSWYALLANIYGVSRSAIEQRERRREARARRIRAAIAGAFLVTVSAGLVVSLYQWRQAVVARDAAFSRELAAQAVGQAQTNSDLSVKLALEALRVSHTAQAEAALREALVPNRVLAVMDGDRAAHTIALSPDGTLLIGGDQRGGLRLWRTETGALVAELAGHTDVIAHVTFSRDGQFAVSASWDGSARIWEVPGGRSVRTLMHGETPVYSAAFSPDGAFVATGDGKGDVRIWDVGAGTLVRTIAAHSLGNSIVHATTRVAYSPDGSSLLTSMGDSSTATGEPVARLWDAASGALRAEFATAGGVIIASAFSADGARVIVAGNRAGVRVWDVASGTALPSFDSHEAIVNVAAFSADGSSALTGDRRSGRMGSVWISNTATGTPRHELYGMVLAAAFDSTGTRVATANDRGAVVWDARTGAVLEDFRGHDGDVDTLVFGANDDTLITASEDGTTKVWDLRPPRPELVIAGKGNAVAGPVFSADGRWLVAQTDVATNVWDARTGAEVASLDSGSPFRHDALFDPHGRLLTVYVREQAPRSEEIRGATGDTLFTAIHLPEYIYAFSPDGRQFVTANQNYTVAIRDSTSWQEVKTLEGHHNRLVGAVFARGGEWLATLAEEAEVRVWNPMTGELLATLMLDGPGVELHPSPDGRVLCAVERSAQITLWDTSTWQRLHTFTWPEPTSGGRWGTAARFSPDGTLLAVTDDRGALHLFDIAARSERAIDDTVDYRAGTIDFSPDGRFIVTTGGGARGARVWDTASGRQLAQLGTQFVRGAAFTPGGGQVATLESDGTVRLFDELRYLPVEELVRRAHAKVKRDWLPRERELYLHEAPAHGP